jgi:hypothetical protein
VGAVASFCASNGLQHEQLCWFTPDYSSLWQPVRQFPQLPTSMLVLALYCGLVFAVLAAPLLAGIGRAPRRVGAALAGWRI